MSGWIREFNNKNFKSVNNYLLHFFYLLFYFETVSFFNSLMIIISYCKITIIYKKTLKNYVEAQSHHYIFSNMGLGS